MILNRSTAVIVGLVIGAACFSYSHMAEPALACWLSACVTFGCAPRVR